MTERQQLGLHFKEGGYFTHDTMQEHALKSKGDWLEFAQLTKGIEFGEETARHYLNGVDGFFFRSVIDGANGAILNGLALSRTVELPAIAQVDAIYSHLDHEQVDDSLHHLWVRRVIPALGMVMIAGQRIGLGLQEVSFGSEFLNAPTKRLLETFGVESDDDGQIAPLITSMEPPDNMLERLLTLKPAPDKNFAIIDNRSQDEQVVHLTASGEQLGQLRISQVNDSRQLLDVDGNTVDLPTPDVVPNSELAYWLNDSKAIYSASVAALLRAKQ